MTEAEVKKELTEEEERRAEAGIVSPHETTAATFIFLGIELEDMQYVFSNHLGLPLKSYLSI